jgi:hypothetical protein
MHLEYQKLMQDFPDLAQRLDALPGRVFGGKSHPAPGSKAIFFCYALPAPGAASIGDASVDASVWSEEKGFTQWYLYDLDTKQIEEEASAIIGVIRCKPETPRQHEMLQETLTDIRKNVEKHIKNSYLRRVQAPQGVKPTLRAWMELS